MGYQVEDDGSVTGILWIDPAMLGTMLEAVRTQFVRDRIAETPWQARAYIVDLEFAERILTTDGPHSFAGGMAWHQVKCQYPVEVAAIRDELTRGLYMAPDAFHRHEREHAEADAARRDQARADAALQQGWVMAGALAVWRRLGGQL